MRINDVAAGPPLEPETLLAARLVEEAVGAGPSGLIHVARSETRAVRLAAQARALAPQLSVLMLPAWDCLPYDRVSPSRAIMGARMAVLGQLAQPRETPVLLIGSVEALMQRLPPPERFRGLRVRVGDAIEPEALVRQLERMGYGQEDLAAEPGEIAVRGEVLDAFPADGTSAVRFLHDAGQITAIHAFDPLTQRSLDEIETGFLGPASELVLGPDAQGRHGPGLEHALPDFETDLRSAFELLPEAALTGDPEAAENHAQRLVAIADAYRSRCALVGVSPDARMPAAPERLYLDAAAWERVRSGRRTVDLRDGNGKLPDFLGCEEPDEAFLDFLEARRADGQRIGLAGPPARSRSLVRLAERRLGVSADKVAGWMELLNCPPGSLAALEGALEHGFATERAVLVAPGDVRPPSRAGDARPTAALPDSLIGMKPGDAVIHWDHGIGALCGIEAVDVGGARMDCLCLEYAGGSRLLVPFDEMDRLWRYGGDAESVTLDHLNTEAWATHRAEVQKQIAASAAELARLARAREADTAPALKPPRAAYRRFTERFPYALTADQDSAVEAVLADLASGRPMDRLVCGDVGFGKTEVALRAAAAAVLCGRQVAVLAPTTVLVRQHVGGFRRRFAELGVRVEALSRLSGAAEARETKAGLADGTVAIAIGTQALAGKGVRFKDLALLIIDEEQRFGARQKAMLRKLGEKVHVLTLTATPIPRTLQTALVGLQDLSVIATPPAMRQPVRTSALPFDEVVVREALRREHRRGGQSFVVCPRIEDIAPMRERIAHLLPELSLLVAHGAMPASEIDEAMVRFADNDADVLLSTDIVESGLDVPRANTMLVWRADLFGLSQLHQLRGRVGRGAAQGVVYLLTDPAKPPGAVAEKRLRTLQTLDRVGAGFAISARDMDQRGAGDLLGDTQAGHVKLIGLELYQHLLGGALRQARGEMTGGEAAGGEAAEGEATGEEWTPGITIAIDAFIPADYVSEETLRIDLYLRLAALLRHGASDALAQFAEEVEDRFGAPPEPVRNLLACARLRARCRRRGIVRLEVGPAAAAAAFRNEPPPVAPPLERRGERVILRTESHTPEQALAVARRLVGGIPHCDAVPRRGKAAAA